jgi:formylglycine-generating enzyme required for sulfatase activity
MGSSPTESEHDLADVSFFESFVAKKRVITEHPQHLVRIARQFGPGKYPVTRGEFASFVQQTGYTTRSGCVFLYFNRFTNHPEGGGVIPASFKQCGTQSYVSVGRMHRHMSPG